MPANEQPANLIKSVAMWWFLGPLYQLYSVVALMLLKLRVKRANSRADRALRALGRKMEKIGIGDELLRQRVGAADNEVRDNPSAENKQKADREAYNLGKIGISATVPIKNAEGEYHTAHETEIKAQELILKHDNTLSKIWPKNALEWVAMILGYVTYIAILYFAYGFVFPVPTPAGKPA